MFLADLIRDPDVEMLANAPYVVVGLLVVAVIVATVFIVKKNRQEGQQK